ncbi:MAG: hypothetical protein Ct9H90mP16_13350 [Candidatus Poseidoniales archaeon]|nr:MAG: hypothetical protein Ct9H90mP16_13350 [Candidatus Poseidoniales archaeon]
MNVEANVPLVVITPRSNEGGRVYVLLDFSCSRGKALGVFCFFGPRRAYRLSSIGHLAK